MLLKSKFDKGEFAILAEMEPPKGVDVSGMVSNAQRVKGKADAFLVPEMNNAVMRMSSLGAAMILQQKGMETVMQVNCRDRNRIALQADLLAGDACGISNVMAVTGEDPSFGDHHQARSVYDIHLPELLQAIRGLGEGRDMAGIELSGSPDFLIGSTINAGTSAPELEIEEMNKRNF
ncbi:methylenetetrahydrofolate reductase [Desulfobacterales bacterium HSG2]|nr:methylenetetrahydrofolate reductase [Desulfobacterales bacterium HSG2]